MKRQVEPQTVFKHCYGHAGNPSVSDTIGYKRPRYELAKLMKNSPKSRYKDDVGHMSQNSQASVAASPSPPGRSRAKQRAVGGEGLANFALDHVFLECQLHVTCEPVECQIESRTSFVPWEASR